MIGNAADAALAATHPEEYLIGEGYSRKAYLINGVVYKVQHEPRMCDNLAEIENIESLRDRLPAGYHLPKARMIGDVIAMEYIIGDLTGECLDGFLGLPCSHANYLCIDPVALETLHTVGWIDSAWGNAIRNDKGVYLIDVAC